MFNTPLLQQPLLSLIIPCYNEGDNVLILIEQLKKVYHKRQDIEFILVDNGSTDISKKYIKDAVNKNTFIRSVEVPINEGYGWGIIQGLNAAKGIFLGWTHADLQTNPYDVLTALSIIEKNGCSPNLYLKGKRKGRSLTDSFFTFSMSIFESILFSQKLWDINAQPNIFHHSFYSKWSNPPKDFSLDLYSYIKAKQQNLHIIRFPVLFAKRIYGKSHWNLDWISKIKFIKRTLYFSFTLKNTQ